MANETTNYKLPKPEADDFYDISEYNKTMDLLDGSLTEMDKKKLDKNGDASEAITEFEQGVLREDIVSGEMLSVTHGKIKKWFSEMKDVAFSGKAKDIVSDAAHRFATDTEKDDWNGKVSASGGDISETVIETLENIDAKYPVPTDGETSGVFLGKVKKFIEDTNDTFIRENITVYVATTGSDTIGTGSSTAPYKTIMYALTKIPKNLGKYTATINVADGTYAESVTVDGFIGHELNIIGNITTPENVGILSATVATVNIRNNQCKINLEGVAPQAPETGTGAPIQARDNFQVCVTHCFINGKTADGIQWSGGMLLAEFNTFNNCSSCVSSWSTANTNNSVVRLGNCDGTNNNYVGYINGGVLQRINNILPQAKYPDWGNMGGIVVNALGAKIGTLQTNTMLYVATTGSNSTGDGSQLNPYKTIQFAVNTLPKDLGSNQVTVKIADGTYNERLVITGFYNGRIVLQSSKPAEISSVCNMPDISITNNPAIVIVEGINFNSTTANAIYGLTSGFILISNCRCVVTSTWSGFSFDQTRFEISYCVVANRGIALHAHGSDGLSINWGDASINNVVGLHAEYGGAIKKNGNQPQATALPERTMAGGLISNQNGTQISSVITSGLSCTWGTLTGGYVRHGNLFGAAMVTVTVQVITTVTLTAGQKYSINGFPKGSMGIDTAVTSNWSPSANSWFTTGVSFGSITFTTTTNPGPGAILQFNVTYPTNS